MNQPWRRTLAGATLLAGLISAMPTAFAQNCGNDGTGYNAWLQSFRGRAAAAGVSQKTIAAATTGLIYDTTVIRLDRGQKSFKLSFEEFYARRVSTSLINRGRQLMGVHQGLLSRIEKQYGVPPAVLVTLWGLETNYASGSGGRLPIIRSLATLAYDCRRSAFFEKELLSALQIVDRGDKSLAQMVGGWAGEIGPMQFLPSSYVKHAVDYDGDGRRDLFNSVPDMLASTANYLKAFGWKAGQPWGPGTANHAVLREWNKAEVYVKTIAAASERMASAR
jgi:lytic murein transglycosylase